MVAPYEFFCFITGNDSINLGRLLQKIAFRDSESSDDSNLLEVLQEASSRELLSLLFRFGLGESFLSQLKERQVVFDHPDLSDADTIHQAAFDSYCKNYGLDSPEKQAEWCLRHSMNSTDLLSEAIHQFRKSELQELLISGSGESMFLRYKDKFDRVLYSLLRVDDPLLCQELFYSIESGEMTFAEASGKYSMGPESKTSGIVGPVDLTTPHPEVSGRLRTAQAGHLIGPFIADDWHTIIRLEFRFDSEFDENTKSFLKELTFKSEINKVLQPEVLSLIQWLSISPSNS